MINNIIKKPFRNKKNSLKLFESMTLSCGGTETLYCEHAQPRQYMAQHVH